jgi:heptaprenylglyceryl phosphate synthase
VRNAFAHADYTLHANMFRSRSEWFEIGGVSTTELHLDAVADVVNRALAFYGSFMDEYEEQRHSYQANKVVLGRIVEGADPRPVEIMADTERGLYGVRSPPEGGPTAVE